MTQIVAVVIIVVMFLDGVTITDQAESTDSYKSSSNKFLAKKAS